jgi:hypothetical protein
MKKILKSGALGAGTAAIVKNPEVLESGILGLGPAAAVKNPDLLRSFGVMGNPVADSLNEDKEKKKKAASGMKKGGSVSASKRADGCARKGKTRGRMV